jgi:tetratricopeptide (TPR) repeat protein
MLNEKQREYIRLNYLSMPVMDMAQILHCDPQEIQNVIEQMNLLANEIQPDSIPPVPVKQPVILHKLDKSDILWGILSFFIPMIVYMLTMCRTLYAGDAGEFSTAGYTLGIPQPPGYPLWMLLLKIANICFNPFLTHPAVSSSLCSALIAGFTVFFLYILLLKLSHSRLVAIAGSLLFAFSYQFWFQALVPETMILNMFFTIATLLLLLLWSENQESRYLLALYLVTGLAFTHHPLFYAMPLIYSYFIVCILFQSWGIVFDLLYLFIYNGILLWVYIGSVILAEFLFSSFLPSGDTFAIKFGLSILIFLPYTLALHWWKKRDNTWIYATLLFILGLSVYFYLPLRITSHPEMSWGNPQTTYDIYNHISRRQYGPLSPIPRVFPFGPETPTNKLGRLSLLGPQDILKEQFLEYWVLFFRQFGSYYAHYSNIFWEHFSRQYKPAFSFPSSIQLMWTLSWVALLLFGMYRLFRKHRIFFIILFGIFFLYGPGMLAVLNYQTTNHSMYIVSRFFIPSFLVGAIWIAIGIQQIIEFLKSKIQEPGSFKYIGYALILIVPLVPLSMNYWNNDLSKNQVAYDFGQNILNSIVPDGNLFIIGDNPTFSIAYLSYVERQHSPANVYDEGENLFNSIHDFGQNKFKFSPNDHARLKDIDRARITMTATTPVYYMSVQNPATPQGDPERYSDYPDFPKIQQVPSGIVYQVLRPGDPPPDYETTMGKMTDLDPFFYNMSNDYYTREVISNYHFLMGRAYYQLYQQSTDPVKKKDYHDKAFYQFKKVSETGWDLDNMHINLAMMYRQENRNDEAMAEYKRALETQPRKAIIYFQMADLYRAMGKPDEAIEKLKKGITLGTYDTDANDPNAYYMLGSLELEKASKILNNRQEKELTDAERTDRQNLISDAINYLNTCISLSPTSVQGYQALGEAYYYNGQFDDAVGMWLHAVQLNDKFYPALMNLYYFYRDHAHDTEKTQEYYTRAMQAMSAAGVNPQ